MQQLEAALRKLSPAELLEVREWLEDCCEDQRQFTAGFESQTRQSEQELAAGAQPRLRLPASGQ